MADTVRFSSPRDLIGREGMALGTTDWVLIDQERVNKFAEATGDFQWIHVDVEKAKAGPFGATIAHGYLTLSMVAFFQPQLFDVGPIRMGVNVGTDKVRFLSPVKVGSRIRAKGELLKAQETPDGGIQATVKVTIEIDGGDKPACIAESVSRYYP